MTNEWSFPVTRSAFCSSGGRGKSSGLPRGTYTRHAAVPVSMVRPSSPLTSINKKWTAPWAQKRNATASRSWFRSFQVRKLPAQHLFASPDIEYKSRCQKDYRYHIKLKRTVNSFFEYVKYPLYENTAKFTPVCCVERGLEKPGGIRLARAVITRERKLDKCFDWAMIVRLK